MKFACRAFSLAASSGLLSACISSHPLPEDVTDNTVMIVKKARCEARDAVVTAFADYLDEEGGPDKPLAHVLRENPSKALIIGNQLSPGTSKILKRYNDGAIAYDFKLNIQTIKAHSSGLNMLAPFTNGSVSIGLGGGLKNQNQAIREFQIADRFSDLVELYKNDYCLNLTSRNFIYPITGNIGIEESVKTFAQLDRDAVFQSAANTNYTRYTDQLTFTTTLDGNLDPTITVNGVDTGKFGVSQTVLKNNYQRVDQHQVTIAIRVPVLKNEVVKIRKNLKANRKDRSIRYTSPVTKGLIDPLEGVLQDLNEKRRLDLIQPLEDFQNRL